MANYDTLKTAVADVIKTNGNKEITGSLLQQTLLAMIDSLGSQYQFAGKAVEGTTPGTVDTKVAYLAGPGTYVNFGGVVIPEQYIGILYGSGSTWGVSTIKVSPIAVQTVIDDIIQLYDGTTPVYPRTRANAVFFDNDTTKTLDQQFNQLDQDINGIPAVNFSIEIPVTAGTEVSYSTIYDLPVVLEAGRRYHIELTNATLVSNIAFYLRKEGSAVSAYWERAQSDINSRSFNSTYPDDYFTPNENVTKYRLYASAAQVVGTGTLKFTITSPSVNDGIKHDIEEINSDIQGLNGRISILEDIIEDETVSGTANVTVGANTDKRTLIPAASLPSSHKYYVKISNGTGEINGWRAYCKRTSVDYQYISPTVVSVIGEYVEITIPDEYISDLISFGFYIFAANVVNSGTVLYNIALKSEITEEFDAIRKELIIAGTDCLPVLDTNPLKRIIRECGMGSIFHSLGFIGDSLSSGWIENTPDPLQDYTYSWGQRLCKLLGVDGYNFSYGGQSAKGWVTNKFWATDHWVNNDTSASLRCWSETGAKTNLKQAYIIMLGVNDYGNLSDFYANGVGDTTTDIGTYDPDTDTDTNADSFIGYYAGIIQRIKSVQPNAKIFVTTLPQAGISDYSTLNTQLRKLPDLFTNTFLIDLWTYAPSFTGSWNTNYRKGFHLSPAGYQYIAYLVNTYLDWIVRNSPSSFKDVAFIGN